MESEHQPPDADASPCVDGAVAFPKPPARRGTASGFHFSQASSWQGSGGSGKFSPSWCGDLVHRRALRSGQGYSLASSFLLSAYKNQLRINDSSGTDGQDNINLLFILTSCGQGLFVHPVFRPP